MKGREARVAVAVLLVVLVVLVFWVIVATTGVLRAGEGRAGVDREVDADPWGLISTIPSR